MGGSGKDKRSADDSGGYRIEACEGCKYMRI